MVSICDPITVSYKLEHTKGSCVVAVVVVVTTIATTNSTTHVTINLLGAKLSTSQRLEAHQTSSRIDHECNTAKVDKESG